MKTKNTMNERFETIAKELGSSFSADPRELTEAQRETMEMFLQAFRDVNTLNDPFVTPAERFRLLAEKHDLSVDEGDVELFLVVEISKLVDVSTLTKKILASNVELREQATEQAIERVFAGIEHTRISRSDKKELFITAEEVASEFWDTLWPGLFKNRGVNTLRSDLADIYERFLLWMRKARDGLLDLNAKDRNRIDGLMKKIIEALNICYMLGKIPIPSDPLVQKLLASDEARVEGLKEYEKALAELEELMPSDRDAKTMRHQAPWLD